MEKRSLIEGPLVKPLLSFSLPLVLGMVGHAFFNLVDVYLVSKLGAAAVAAVHLASVVNFIPMILFNGVGVSTVAYISRASGAGDREQVYVMSRDSLLLAFFAGIFLGWLGFVTAAPVVRLLATTGEAAPLAVECLQLASIGTVTMFLLLQVSSILRALGDSFWPMLLLIGGNVLNIVLCLILIYGWGPIEPMGVIGSLWATILSRGVFGLLGLFVLMRRGLHRAQEPWSPPAFARRCWNLIRVGVPSGAQIFMRVIAVLTITGLVQSYDQTLGQNLAAAAYGIGVRLDMLALFGAAGWGGAAATVVGMNLGAAKPDRAASGAWVLCAMAGLMMVAVGICYYFFAGPLMDLVGMNPSPLQIEYGADYLRVIAFSYPFVAGSIVLSSALNGAGVTRLPLLFDFLGFVVIFIPAAFWSFDRFGLEGLWWLLVAINAALAGLYALCFNRGSWKHAKLHS